MAYYDITGTAELGCQYNLIFGERSNGKTTAGLIKAIEDYTNGLGRAVYIRQMDMDLKGQRGANIMNSLRYGGPKKDLNLIEQSSGGEYDQVKYYSRAWYLGKTLDDETVRWEKEPFCYAMAISNAQHDKSATPPQVRNIIFDEFIPLNGNYLVDETALFRNLVSTIIRDVDTVQIFMFANTISWNSPYFELFGATKKVRQMEIGETVVLTMSEKPLMRAAFEYTPTTEGGKKSDVYFAFADEHSSMIVNGQFAVPEYPQCPHAFTSANVKCTFWFLISTGERVRGRLMRVGRETFIFCDQVAEERYEVLVDERRDLFYSLDFSGKPNHYISPLQRYRDKRTHYLVDAYAAGRMFFSSNEVGEDLMYFTKVAADKSILSL